MSTTIKKRETTNAVVIHSSLTFPKQHVDRAVITSWHRAQGWADIGYHVVIRRDGGIEAGRSIDSVGAHTLGWNHRSVGVVLAGGLDTIPGHGPFNEKLVTTINGKRALLSANYTELQWQSLAHVVAWLEQLYPIETITGHRDAVADKRPCPCFSVSDWLKAGRVPVPTSLEA
jgi:N-acetylmuramoyl-L-alanine amidase